MKGVPALQRKLDQETPNVLSSYESLSTGDLWGLSASQSVLTSLPDNDPCQQTPDHLPISGQRRSPLTHLILAQPRGAESGWKEHRSTALVLFYAL